MKKLNPKAYRSLFLKHFQKFMESVTLVRELEGKHVVGVSGGRDSMTLLWLLHHFHATGDIGPIRAVFIHHHTRAGQDQDQKVVEKFCKDHKIPLKVLHARNLLEKTGNFEERARKIRRELLNNELSQGESLWLGHHINDSYEWAIMQRNRTSHLMSTLGIPVRNGRIIRPLMCVSRKQIERFSNFEHIPFRDDPTNLDLHYDRNYFRHKVVAAIADRYPSHLKHYVNISNMAAMNLGKSIIARNSLIQVYSYEDGAVLIGMKFDVVQIQELMHAYSSADRGELVGPIGRMLDAIRNGKKGPFQFSGGLEAYHSHTLLMIYRKKFKNSDEAIAKILSALPNSTLENIATYRHEELQNAFQHIMESPKAMCDMPGLILVMENPYICKVLNTSVFDARFPEVSKVCQERGLRFITYTKCLARWKSHKKNLPEKLRLLPLWNLSHLFSSQQ